MTEIRWVNHASYVLEHASVRLIHDPWIDGTAFDHGWELLAPTRFSIGDFSDITHVWFSHEHPDHFVPANLMAIPSEVRARIQVLYQSSTDRRVASFCERAGFGAITEMQAGQWLQLAEDLSLLCEPHDNGDSWLAVKSGGRTWLNLNDCVITSPRECRSVLEKVGKVDVLLSQFSYANWVGNPGEHERMERAAREKLGWFLTQVRTIEPTWIIPFASFVYFAHEDNFFLNDHINRIDRVVEELETTTGSKPVVLYPGDVWNPDQSTSFDCRPAIERYMTDLERVLRDGPTQRSEPVDLKTLIAHGETFVSKLRQRNGLATRLLPSAQVHVEDLGTVVRVTPTGITELPIEGTRIDLACKSDALDYAFRFDWGGRTLDINGRFTTPRGGQYARFKAFATLAGFNSRGEGWTDIGHTVLSRARKRLRKG